MMHSMIPADEAGAVAGLGECLPGLPPVMFLVAGPACRLDDECAAGMMVVCDR
jgi:hypothetical protein